MLKYAIRFRAITSQSPNVLASKMMLLAFAFSLVEKEITISRTIFQKKCREKELLKPTENKMQISQCLSTLILLRQKLSNLLWLNQVGLSIKTLTGI